MRGKAATRNPLDFRDVDWHDQAQVNEVDRELRRQRVAGELDEAIAARDALLQRIEEGDFEVTAEDLFAADEAIEKAREVAIRKVGIQREISAARREARRQARIADLEERLDGYVKDDPTARIVNLRQQAHQALAALFRVAQENSRQVRALYDEAEGLRATGRTKRIHSRAEGYRVIKGADGREVADSEPMAVVRSVIDEALKTFQRKMAG